MKKLLLATAVSALSVSAFASHSYFANKNVYVTANAGLGFPVKTTYGIYNGKNKMSTGFDMSAAVGYTFLNTQQIAARLELQYLFTHNGYSNDMKAALADITKQYGGKAHDSLAGNYIMVNGLFDWKFNPKFTATVGLGLGYAHLNALISKPTTALPTYFSSENTAAVGFILGGSYNINKQFAVGVNYEALMTSTDRAGKTATFTPSTATVTNNLMINNLLNVSLSYRLGL